MCPEFGTFGRMAVGGKIIWTVERPWQSNESNISSIPQGTYNVQRHTSPKHGECWILQGGSVEKYKTDSQVHHRWGILIHPANAASQLQGCIAPGFTRGCYKGDWAVLNSRNAINYMLKTLPSDWKLRIEGSTTR